MQENEVEVPVEENDKQYEERGSDNDVEEIEADDQTELAQQKVPAAIYKRFYGVYFQIIIL